MMKEALIFGMLFFGFMTLFNAYMAVKRKQSFAPAMVAFLMMVTTVLFYFGQFLYGLVSFVVSVLVAVVKSKETSKELEKQFSTELKKNGIREPLRIRDFISWKGWVKMAVRWGASKAAMFYALFVAAVAIIIWALLIWLFPAGFEEAFQKKIYLYAISSSVVFYVYLSRAFEKALKNVNIN